MSAAGRVDWIEIDTRSDDDLLSGSALGCAAGCGLRSCHCVPWPASTPSSRRGCARACRSSATFARRPGHFPCRPSRAGVAAASAGGYAALGGRMAFAVAPASAGPGVGRRSETLPGSVAAGPGWRVSVAERRARWASAGQCADAHLQTSPAEAPMATGATRHW